VEVRGRTLLIALAAALSLLSATAVAGGHRVLKGSKGDDELTLGSAANRVFARGGDDQVTGGGGNDRLRGGRGDDALFGGAGRDRLLGGQDSDLLDGGDGNDVLNGGGDGRDKDRIVCGDGYDGSCSVVTT
jgi:Ca2+-binding RTX toxin-like protein